MGHSVLRSKEPEPFLLHAILTKKFLYAVLPLRKLLAMGQLAKGLGSIRDITQPFPSSRERSFTTRP